MRKVRSPNATPNLRVIKTARTVESINAAAQAGFRPLVKPVVPSPAIKTKFAVNQNIVTKEIQVARDYRDYDRDPDTEQVIDFTFYYPYVWENPFAAYLIPQDLVAGERVYLEDLIEDYVGLQWNQGDVYRLEGCEAIWNGQSFEVQYDPDATPGHAVG
mgnify:CR=1 FL=1